MFRWQGDSEKQKAERNQRQAKRFIRQLPTSESDDEFQDCDTSLSKSLNLDGNDDTESLEDEGMDAAQVLAAEKRKPVEIANFPDDDDAWKKEIKLKFNNQDVKYWFNFSRKLHEEIRYKYPVVQEGRHSPPPS